MNRYDSTKEYILKRLENGLSHDLYYHGLHHTLDVLQAAEMICEKEGISDHEMELLKVAVLFHDSGFLISSTDHEKIGCDFVREALPAKGYNSDEIEKICSLIMATKFPHLPTEKLQFIICDADLDYLGRDDFYTISDSLYKELIEFNNIQTKQQWDRVQETFLQTHRYFTFTSYNLRDAKKQQHLKEVMKANQQYI